MIRSLTQNQQLLFKSYLLSSNNRSSSKKSMSSCCEPEKPVANTQPSKGKQSKGGQKKPETKPFAQVFNDKFPTLPSPYVDTHCHIDAIVKRFQTAAKTEEEADSYCLDKLVTDFHLGDWDGCVTVACEPHCFDNIMKIIDDDTTGKIRGAFGVHPHEAKLYNDDVEAQIVKAMNHEKVVALGECGLDYYYDNSPRDIQQAVFIRQMELAVEHKKPLVVHTREAEEDTVNLLIKHLPKDWVFHIHCCTSSKAMVEPLLAHFPNMHVGFTGVITFGTADSIRETLSIVPVDRLLLETDAPYMAPIPFRGAIAHSGMIPFIAEKMAEVKQVSLEELMKQVRINTKNVYGI